MEIIQNRTNFAFAAQEARPAAPAGRFIPLKVAGYKIAIVVLRITAKAVALFGNRCKSAAKTLRVKARRIYAIHVLHNSFSTYSIAPLPLLACTRNIARRDCIQKREDITAAKLFREKFLQQGGASPEVAKKIREIKFSGAQVKGICFGATHIFVRSVAHVTSEKELQAIAKTYQEGFPAEAAGLQAIYGKHSKILIQNYAKAINRLKKEKAETVIKKINDPAPFAALVGLQCQEGYQFDRFDRDNTVQTLFGQLPKGSYKLSFNTYGGSHAIGYLKFDFGSYLFDPNKGLMKCPSRDGSEGLFKLLTRYALRKNEARTITAHRYTT